MLLLHVQAKNGFRRAAGSAKSSKPQRPPEWDPQPRVWIFVRYIIPDFRSLYHSRPFEVLRSAVTGEGLHRGLSWLRDSSRFLTHDTYLGFHRCKREPDFMQLQVHRRHSQRKKAQKKCSITTKT